MKKKKQKKKHCLPKLAIEESEAMSKGFSSFFPISLGWKHWNPAPLQALLRIPLPQLPLELYFCPKRNNTYPCHKCPEEYCDYLHHRPETWTRLTPNSEEGLLWIAAIPPWRQNEAIIMNSWELDRNRQFLKQKGLFFPADWYLPVIIIKFLLQWKLSVRKVYYGSANKVSVSVRMMQKTGS